MQLLGVHHLTAVTADAPGNRRFYVDVLGLRLVKKSVNQDESLSPLLCRWRGDASAYHLLRLARPRKRARQICRTSCRVAGSKTLAWWRRRSPKPA
jgi:glyoxalase family protein